MKRLANAFLFLLFVCLPATLFADLFEQDDPLHVEIQSTFELLESERNKDTKYPGSLTIDETLIPIELNVRGNNRLKKKICKFAPLKVDFKKSPHRKKTPFHKEGDLKLVVLCKKNDRYIDYLRSEYLTYKMLNILTPLSYRVRWVNVTYKTGDTVLGERPAFFVEHKKRVAKRNNLGLDQPKNLPFYENLEQHQAALIEQFQYFAGNTDYSLLRSRDPGECCHNAKLLSHEQLFVPIIYDFDASGMVSTSYAVPAPGLKISSVKKRLFRGYCQEEPALQIVRQQILDAKEEILTLVNSDSVLSKSGRKKTLRYATKSFEYFEKDKLWKKNILNSCRPV